jgi:hypothetical protein
MHLSARSIFGDSDGPSVLRVAANIRVRSSRHAERVLVDPAMAANLLEEVAAALTRVRDEKYTNRDAIREIEAHLFRAFLKPLK